MIKVTCELSENEIYEWCDWEGLEKPQWEHIVNKLYRLGGNAFKNLCPQCKQETLQFDFGKERE